MAYADFTRSANVPNEEQLTVITFLGMMGWKTIFTDEMIHVAQVYANIRRYLPDIRRKFEIVGPLSDDDNQAIEQIIKFCKKRLDVPRHPPAPGSLLASRTPAPPGPRKNYLCVKPKMVTIGDSIVARDSSGRINYIPGIPAPVRK